MISSVNIPQHNPRSGTTASALARLTLAIVFLGPSLVCIFSDDDTLRDVAAVFGTSPLAVTLCATGWQFFGFVPLMKLHSRSTANPSAEFKARIAKLVDCLRVQLIAMFAIFGLLVATSFVWFGIEGLALNSLETLIVLGCSALVAILSSLVVALHYQWRSYPKDRPKWPFRRADKGFASHDK